MTVEELLTPDNPELNSILIAEAENRLAFVKEEGSSTYFEGREFKPAVLADRLVREVFFPKQVVSFAGEVGYESWRYIPDRGIYVEDRGNEWLNQIVKGTLGDEAKRSRISDVVYLMQIGTAIPREEFQQSPHILVLLNGVYDLSDGTLHDFSPDYCATVALPVAYDPSAGCPAICRYLEGVKPTWGETETDATHALIEFAAYILYNGFPIHRLLILYGEQGSGKSTFLNLLGAFLGADNRSSVTLQAVDQDQYAAALLFGKLANISSDISSKALKTSGFLKATTGFDTITTNRKYKGHLEFQWTGKHIFSANEVPPSYDTSDAFHVRVLLINFPIVFRGTENDDQQLLSKLTQPSELSGLLNLCLKALPDLLERRCFKDEPTLEQRKLNYLKQSDPAAYFVEAHLEPDENGVVTNGKLYAAYRRMCINELGVKPKASESFGKTLAQALSFGEQDIAKVQGRTTKFWCGVRIKDAPDPTPEPSDTNGQQTLDTKTEPEPDEAMIEELISFTERLGGKAEYEQAEAHLKSKGFTIPRDGLPGLVRRTPGLQPVNAYSFMLDRRPPNV